VGFISGAGASKEYAQQKAFVARALEDEKCSICLELVADESNFQLKCGHSYHAQCIKELASTLWQ
jgi:hypothetical protein